MKEINLPITVVFSTESIRIEDKSTKTLTIDLGYNNSILEIVRRNGGKLLYATSSLELDVDELIKTIFFTSNSNNEKTEYFDRIILKSSDFSLGFKKKILINCISKFDLLKGKDKDNFENSFTKVIDWRNAFAHGNLEFNNSQGALLHYFSGQTKTLEINDEFWDLVVGTFKTVKDLITKISQTINIKD